MRGKAGESSLCGNVREERAKCGSVPPNAGGLATMQKLVTIATQLKLQTSGKSVALESILSGMACLFLAF